jgi:hypothetical protein
MEMHAKHEQEGQATVDWQGSIAKVTKEREEKEKTCWCGREKQSKGFLG